jgi:hypothetical protein
MTPAEALAARKPPPPLDTPEAEEADVRRRANFRYPEDKQFTEDHEWFEWFDVGPSDYGVTTVEDDALVLTGAPPPRAGYPHGSCFRGALYACEFVMEARIAKLEGPDDYPFGFLHHAMPVNFYGFVLYGNGNVDLIKFVGGEWSQLAHVERVPHVNRGNAENVLKAVRRHGRLHIFVNDRHVLTGEDFDLGAMALGVWVRSGVRGAFSDIRVQGISARKVFHDIDTHMARLETREAREKLEYMRLYAPMFVAPRIEQALRSPDRSATVLVTLPSGARLTRRGDAPAKRLVDAINAKGTDRPSHWATDVTETEVESDETYLECPLISIGHPDWTAMTRRLRDQLPRDTEVSTDEILIYHDIERGDRRVALWGHGTGLLDKFLAMVWEGG